MNVAESHAAFMSQRGFLKDRGVYWGEGCPEPYGFVSNDPRMGCPPQMAMDAIPTLSTDPNAGIPSLLTTWIDPEIFKIRFAPLRAVEIVGPEKQAGDWTLQTAMFPVTEVTGETTAYGDYNTGGGKNSANANFPQRQSFLFQAIIEYGDLEVARYALAKINWITEKQAARMRQLNTYENFTYFYGVAGLANYGLLTDPNLPASISPAPKAKTGTGPWLSGTTVVATANEIFGDLQSLFIQAVNQNAGLVDRNTKAVLAMDPAHEAALTQTNAFNVNVSKLIEDNFPNWKVVSAVQYGPASAGQPQGQVSGLSIIQLIFPEVEGQRTAQPMYNAKVVAQRIVYDMSSARQKCLSGTFGCVIRYASGIATLAGV